MGCQTIGFNGLARFVLVIYTPPTSNIAEMSEQNDGVISRLSPTRRRRLVSNLRSGFLDKHLQFIDDAPLVNDRGMEVIKITLLDRSNASGVNAIEFFFQDAPPLPPELHGACDQRPRHRPFDVVTSGLGTCAAAFLCFATLSSGKHFGGGRAGSTRY